ncbi:MAG: leucine--tRNA ligase [Gammaproteobacteria bacterium]|nr:leucine--tRNA ligase [Gammaproteobacteria bacterium]
MSIPENYNHLELESTLQKSWDEQQLYKATESLTKEKFYCLSMFPYPSGTLHVGHVRNYTLADVIARYQRLQGKNVMQPIGWDAFGLPAENAAIKNKVAPAKWTYENIDHMRKQFKQLGLAYDWSRELATCSPDYYKWEQWLFLQMLKKGLAYKKNAVVNWDPVDNTVLANEQVIDGRGWRSGALIERREISQWFLKITDYADELLDGLDKLPGWPEQVKTMQRNWIGRSKGLQIRFSVEQQTELFEVFTTRPDTLFGVTYLAIAPTHPLAQKAAEKNPRLAEFIEECRNIETAEAAMATLEKRGVDSGLFALNPIDGTRIPIWVANYVLSDYGTGAVMGVPAHDQRDWEFAQQYDLLIKVVIVPVGATRRSPTAENREGDQRVAPTTDYGILINSGEFNGLNYIQAFAAIATALEKKGLGEHKVNYRLRDWGVSRQRYWGAPIPIIYCKHCGTVPVPEKDLPVVLPTDVTFTDATSPLKNIPEFYQTTCPTCARPAVRETDTFDTFVESSWYYARFASKGQTQSMLDDRAKYWTPVDQYVGGIEHAVMHLLYARFFHKLLRDEGLLNSDEPFVNLLTQGMVLKDGSKMSKSKGNTVDPQQLVEKYGADTLRLFSIFTAPPEQSLEWSDSGVEGSYRFLKKLWNFSHKHQKQIRAAQIANRPFVKWKEEDPRIQKYRYEMYLLLQQINQDYARNQLNTIVSAAMKLLHLLNDFSDTLASALTSNLGNQSMKTAGIQLFNKMLSILLRILYPIVPHITDYLWRELKFNRTIHTTTWPKVACDALVVDSLELVVQVNGKLRARIEVNSGADEASVKQLALEDPNIVKFLDGKNALKIIYVPQKLVNIVVDS